MTYILLVDGGDGPVPTWVWVALGVLGVAVVALLVFMVVMIRRSL